LFFLFASVPPSSGEQLEFLEFRSENVIIRYEEPLKSVVSEIVSAYPEIRSSLEKELLLDVLFRPTIFLINTDAAFLEMVNGNRLVTAFARPRNNAIVIDYSKMLTNPFDLELTLKHELCHLLLHHHISRKMLPKWLNEGVSQWVSEGVADIVNFDGNKILKQAVLSNNYLALGDISRGFPRSRDLFILSYEQSKSIVEYIDSTYGTEKLLNILNELRKGNSIEQAVSTVLSVNLQKVEHDWHGHLRRKYTWMRYVSDNIYWLLFFFGAVVTVIGFLRLWVKYKTYKDEDGEYTDIEH
jgi:hypothetical protein